MPDFGPPDTLDQPVKPLEPSFSVVIPLYQKVRWIGRCLESIRAQAHAAFEVIVVDDGSTDGGGDVVRSIGAGWVQCVRQDNAGAAAARNTGIARAQGTYIALIDADDTWSPNHLAVLARLANAHPDATLLGTAWCQFGKPMIDPALTSEPTVVDLDLYLERGIANRQAFCSSVVAFPRNVLARAGHELFPRGSRLAEDQDAWITLLRAGYGVRSLEMTARYELDTVNPTIAAPRIDDFKSVIFDKWSRDPQFQSGRFIDFVATHRLLTIERHAGSTPMRVLLKAIFETRSISTRGHKLRAVARVLLAPVLLPVLDLLAPVLPRRFMAMRRSVGP
jgi:glycosyltransferase involved in cell wall biosynthesis